MLPRLVTIPISHYGERARWALDFAGIDYEETHHLQMFSWGAAFSLGDSKTLPVLVTRERTLNDSAEVLRWAHERGNHPLFPRKKAACDEVERLSYELAGAFGVETRRFAYSCFFASLDACLPYNAGRAPDYQVELFSRLRRYAVFIAKNYLQVSPDAVARGLDVVDRTFDAIGQRLQDGRRYLVGDAFSAADLTFASMAAPSLLPARYGVPLPDPREIPAEAAARVERWRDHPAGRWALGLYEGRPAFRGVYERALRVQRSP